ncbi:hypothetical protein RS030_192853 [Cryptosporidium xiaoi]|uniref:General transcription and DNA repair factor IIH subunit TFB5 n=1 Tax=Cryptosporidium xiaoi TaxID=659607 RepID=A0AAV9XZ49_9CRYT
MVKCQRGLFVRSDQASLEVIRQMNMTNPFIQLDINNEYLFCSGISKSELESEVFSRLRNAERPKENSKR